MISKDEKLNFKEILEKIGFPRKLEDFRATYKYNANMEMVKKFELELKKAKNFDEIINCINNNSEIFDKEIYAFHVGKLLPEDYTKAKEVEFLGKEFIPKVYNSKYSIKPTKATLENCRRILSKVDVVDISINVTTRELIIESSQEFVGNENPVDKKLKRNTERLEEIEEKIGLKKLVKKFIPKDFIDFCVYANLGNALANRILESLNKKQKNLSENKKNNKEKKLKDFEYNKFIETIKKYVKYIDIDKMLLLALSISYYKYENNFEKCSYKEVIELRKFTEKVESLLDNEDVSMISQRFNNKINFETINSSINTLNNCFVNGKFCTIEEINIIEDELKSGKRPIGSIDKNNFINTFKFTIPELVLLISIRPETLQELIENNFITNEEIEKIIKDKIDFTNEQLIYLYELKYINEEKIFDLYMKGNILLEDICFLKENSKKIKELEKILSSEKLVELYLDIEKKEEFEKYQDLYKTLLIDGKSFEEKKEKSSEILWQSIEIFDKEKIKELYDKGLIVIDSLIDFGGIDICISLFVNGKLKPIDAKRLYENNTITQSMIEDILSDVNIKNTHKIVLIYSTFSENKYDEFRKELVLKYLSNFSEISQKDFLEEYIDKEKCDIFEGKNKGVISSCSKWNLISKIDLEYSQELLEDNHIIFYLPNEKKYIIDRLYDSNDNPVYGNATFIIKENIFKENKNLIIKENKINKNGLVILSKNIKKIVNTGWRNAIIKYFNIDDSEVYTEEQIKTIKLLAQEVENSKKSVMI